MHGFCGVYYFHNVVFVTLQTRFIIENQLMVRQQEARNLGSK